MNRLVRINIFYERYESKLSSFSLLAGFLFDIFVLNRIDQPAENFWIICHILIAVFGIFLLNRKGGSALSFESSLFNYYHWLLLTVQFAFGGILSTFLVFYFRSGTVSESWPFLFILSLAFVFNEIFKKNYSQLTFQVGYLFLSVFAFAIYIVPIFFERMGPDVFIFSGLLSLFFILLFILFLSFVSREDISINWQKINYSVFGIYALVNLFYFANIIPPIPLSLKDVGVYHNIKKGTDGSYNVSYLEGEGRAFLSRRNIFFYNEGTPVYVYSAIFSPTKLNTIIIHEWQNYNKEDGFWFTINEISLPIYGGREYGYRTYSLSERTFPGIWRVNVKTLDGKVIGRFNFEIVIPYRLEKIFLSETKNN